MRSRKKARLGNFILLLLVPVVLISGVILFDDRKYVVISLAIAVISCASYYLSFEKKGISTRMLVLLSILIALCVIGRFLFLAIPGFKPVTAIVVLAGMYFGTQAGFMTGSMAALLSNLLFGQGPWTPFQMMAWGMIGFLAGLPRMQRLLQKKIPLMIYGVMSGILYSVIMDVWSTIAAVGSFQIARFWAKMITSLPFMILYAISNVFFLWIIRKPIGEKLARIKMKYGLNQIDELEI